MSCSTAAGIWLDHGISIIRVQYVTNHLFVGDERCSQLNPYDLSKQLLARQAPQNFRGLSRNTLQRSEIRVYRPSMLKFIVFLAPFAWSKQLQNKLTESQTETDRDT